MIIIATTFGDIVRPKDQKDIFKVMKTLEENDFLWVEGISYLGGKAGLINKASILWIGEKEDVNVGSQELDSGESASRPSRTGRAWLGGKNRV